MNATDISKAWFIDELRVDANMASNGAKHALAKGDIEAFGEWQHDLGLALGQLMMIDPNYSEFHAALTEARAQSREFKITEIRDMRVQA